jgi:hypothetical protein
MLFWKARPVHSNVNSTLIVSVNIHGAVQQKWSQKWNLGNSFLYHNNATAHSALFMREILA